jgi:hypothetical protein
MKHLIWFGVVLALLLSVMPATPVLAQYQVQPPPGSDYDSLLQNFDSGLCLQPENEAPINGYAIVQQPCNVDDPYQRWSFQGLNLQFDQPGTYLVINSGGRQSGSRQCLDDRDGKTADGSPVQQWTCNFTSDTMVWKLETAGYDPEWVYPPPWAQFINMRSGKCLDVRGGSSVPGTALQIYHCTTSGQIGQGANLAQVFQWVGTRQIPPLPPTTTLSR